ncbi:kielin/chordin-like protein [Ischnura elegans]|uniref:kielin/chordin-like protein n=1 Tax=Ischnura elegans TaxID=197161 RepID=UPI001ED8925A|nr:kielin/chordin-like protein [Ischnura elegans]
MEGLKFTVALALLLAVFTVDASPVISGNPTNPSQSGNQPHGVLTCEQIPCKNTNYERFADPADPCSYCCCSDGDEFAKTQKCDNIGLFNPDTGKCHGTNMCPCGNANCSDECLNGWIDYPVKNPDDPCGFCICPKDGSAPYPGKCNCSRFEPTWMQCVPDTNVCPCACKDIECRRVLHGQDEVRFSNPNDECGFCCCRPDLTDAIPLDCPFHERYDNVTNDCVPDPTHHCPPPHPSFPPASSARPPPVTPPHGHGDGGCETVKCPVDPDTAPLYACPNDPHSFCQCDWGEVAHTMPCGPGTTFNQKMQACL